MLYNNKILPKNQDFFVKIKRTIQFVQLFVTYLSQFYYIITLDNTVWSGQIVTNFKGKL